MIFKVPSNPKHSMILWSHLSSHLSKLDTHKHVLSSPWNPTSFLSFRLRKVSEEISNYRYTRFLIFYLIYRGSSEPLPSLFSFKGCASSCSAISPTSPWNDGNACKKMAGRWDPPNLVISVSSHTQILTWVLNVFWSSVSDCCIKTSSSFPAKSTPSISTAPLWKAEFSLQETFRKQRIASAMSNIRRALFSSSSLTNIDQDLQLRQQVQSPTRNELYFTCLVKFYSFCLCNGAITVGSVWWLF